jgi:hypothetical protein
MCWANITSDWLCASPLGAAVVPAVVADWLLACSLLELLLQPAAMTSAAKAAVPVTSVRFHITLASIPTGHVTRLVVQ